MTNPYRTPGAMFFVPRRKGELIDLIVKSGWNGTKTSLREKEHRELKAILIRMRNAHFDKFMTRTPVENKLTKVENSSNIDTVKGEL
jgi:hypothetical protein